MAEQATIARPYVEAIYQVAQNEGKQEQWAQVLKKLAQIAVAPEFAPLPLDPKVAASQIVDLLLSLIGDEQQVPAMQLKQFLQELVANKRLQSLPEIQKQFQQMQDAGQGAAEAMIYTAYPLSEAQLAELMPILEKRFGSKLKPQVQLDESLIGGICAVVGDDTLDMSVKARLEQMKQALIA